MDDLSLVGKQHHDRSDTFHEVGSGSGLNDAHVGDVGVLSISERAVSASIEASMHTPKAGDFCIGYEEDLIVGEPSVIKSSGSRTNLTPARDFNFPWADIRIIKGLPDALKFDDDFQDVKHITDGSNAHIYLAKFEGKTVIIKMLKEKFQHSKAVIREFDTEYCCLIRLNHPNIIKVLGAGRNPRRFMVMEYLSGGTLQSLLHNQDTGRASLATRFLHQGVFRSRAFTYTQALKKMKDLASALLYLHDQVQEGVTIVHRDLKPDNIGFTENGVLKLFDFGLCTCIQSRQVPTDTYAMTGGTGSIRYMAPEVAKKESYTELVDVYSFSILAWQMIKDKLPFMGMNKTLFIMEVVRKGLRPKIDPSWPLQLSSLLQSCWNADRMQRPSFKDVVQQIDQLIAEDAENDRSKEKKGGGFLGLGIGSPLSSPSKKPARVKPAPSKSESSWF